MVNYINKMLYDVTVCLDCVIPSNCDIRCRLWSPGCRHLQHSHCGLQESEVSYTCTIMFNRLLEELFMWDKVVSLQEIEIKS